MAELKPMEVIMRIDFSANNGVEVVAHAEKVQELVRCEDCLHYENGFCYNPNTYDDEKTRGNTIPNWFCADGKRREDVEETD